MAFSEGGKASNRKVPPTDFFSVFIFPGNRLIHKNMYDHFQIAHLGAITGNWAAELSPSPSPPG